MYSCRTGSAACHFFVGGVSEPSLGSSDPRARLRPAFEDVAGERGFLALPCPGRSRFTSSRSSALALRGDEGPNSGSKSAAVTVQVNSNRVIYWRKVAGVGGAFSCIAKTQMATRTGSMGQVGMFCEAQYSEKRLKTARYCSWMCFTGGLPVAARPAAVIRLTRSRPARSRSSACVAR